MEKLNRIEELQQKQETKKKSDLRLIKTEEVQELQDVTIPDQELEKICIALIGDEEKKYALNKIESLGIKQKDEKIPYVSILLNHLQERPISQELPIKDEIFVYKRNLKISKELKQKVARLLNFPVKEEADYTKDELSQRKGLESDTTKLLVLEKRKADWLEKNYNPIIFAKALKTSQAEVRQFLIKQLNVRELDKFTDPLQVEVILQDELNYLLEGNSPDSGGIYSYGTSYVRIPPEYIDKNEWDVFHVTVHELLHAVSFRNYERLGLHIHFAEPDFKEVNEAITETVTYFIMKEHIESKKTYLQGQNQRKLYLSELSYSEYTSRLKEVTKKIPLHFFIDAMLNEKSLDKLEEKFAEEFDDPDALQKFAIKLSDLFKPKIKKAKIISLKEYSEKIGDEKLPEI
ncbi:MAG: hypothetical protein NT116_04140 [Candidatus Parcubacteria bacterium]|nr:hypothetical protein [Candidatus Parcubacteria bacterium]